MWKSCRGEGAWKGRGAGQCAEEAVKYQIPKSSRNLKMISEFLNLALFSAVCSACMLVLLWNIYLIIFIARSFRNTFFLCMSACCNRKMLKDACVRSSVNALWCVNSPDLWKEKFYWPSSAGRLWALIPTSVKAPYLKLKLVSNNVLS